MQVEWTFSEGLGSWSPLRVLRSRSRLSTDGGTLRLSLSGDVLAGGVYTELEGWDYDDWGAIVVRARTRHPVRGVAVLFDLEGDSLTGEAMDLLMQPPEIAPLFADGEDLTYAFPVRRPEQVTGDAPGGGSVSPFRHPGSPASTSSR